MLQHHYSSIQSLKTILSKKTLNFDVFLEIENQKLKNDKVCIEEERERLKINKNHLDLDLKV